MRVTNQMLSSNVLQNIQRNLGSMQKYQEQLSSGRSVSKPSDNPMSTVRIMSLNTSIKGNEQHKKNIDSGISWLGATDSALTGVRDVMQRSREICVYGASDTLSDDSRLALAHEVEQLRDNLMQIANSDIEGRHIFGGHKTTDTPYVEEAGENGETKVEYKGDGGKLNWEMAKGVTMDVNLTGEELFTFEVDGEEGEEGNLFDVLNTLEKALIDGDTDKISNEILKNMDEGINNVLNHTSVVGARMNRLEMATDRSFEDNLNMTTGLTELYDIDMAEVLMNYKVQENVYMASLSTGARAVQPSLVDYLR